jgi:hypothetical protein
VKVPPRVKQRISATASRPESANGYIGRGTRYRLGEFLCGFYSHEDDDARNDVEGGPARPLGESLKLAAELAQLSSGYPCDSVRVHNGPASLQSGAWRYWVGIARGARGAKQLLTDLNDSSASRIGWPLYWTKDNVYLFSDSTGRSGPRDQSQYYNLTPPANFDYELLTREAAILKVKDQLWNFDHLGELDDIPDFGADEIVAGAGGGITVNVLSVDQAGEPSARLFQPYSGGSQSSICVGVNRFTQNAFGCQVRCARHRIPTSPPRRFAMYAKGVAKSPLKRWLIDSGCGHDLVGHAEVAKLKKMFKQI